jgi:hypothetical protein
VLFWVFFDPRPTIPTPKGKVQDKRSKRRRMDQGEGKD